MFAQRVPTAPKFLVLSPSGKMLPVTVKPVLSNCALAVADVKIFNTSPPIRPIAAPC
jgi:hypothetical protein